MWDNSGAVGQGVPEVPKTTQALLSLLMAVNQNWKVRPPHTAEIPHTLVAEHRVLHSLLAKRRKIVKDRLTQLPPFQEGSDHCCSSGVNVSYDS